MISEFWAYFHCACAQTAIRELLVPDLQRIVSATYKLLMISGTYDKLRQRQRCLERILHYNWKPKRGFRRKITILVQFVCHLAMLEGFDSFYNDVNYDEVTKTQHAVMRAKWGAVQLENAMPTKPIDIKLADNKPILILYLWLKDHSTKGHSCVYTPHFFRA